MNIRSGNYHRHAGFSLITANFLIVVVAGLGVFMVTISSVQQQTSSFSLLTSRALFGADGGLQWGIRRIVQDAAAGLNCTVPPAPPGQVSFTTAGGGVDGYSVTVTCSVHTITENPDVYNIYDLTSRASRGVFGSPDYHERTLRASITNAP